MVRQREITRTVLIMEVQKMFRQYYGMSINPFEKSLSTDKAFITSDMKEMEGRLEYIKNHPGIGLFTAGPGYGKTFALRRFAENLNPNITKFVYICLSTVSTTEFYKQLCNEFGLVTSQKKSSMFKELQEYFKTMSYNKRIHCIICLDEAQYLNNDILKDLKMLCNFEMDSQNCFSLILLGQPSLINILLRQPHEALRQRIIINYSFNGLSEEEAREYIADRMELANASRNIFDDNAILTAYSSCTGSIRKLNLIITKALIIGAQNKTQHINTDMVLSAINEIALL